MAARVAVAVLAVAVLAVAAAAVAVDIEVALTARRGQKGREYQDGWLGQQLQLYIYNQKDIVIGRLRWL